ncbi:hypothetical protein RRG08_026511 [Elysia crispata]|uniref:Mutator-like transposase domain-containing protein n=1 Tax=Elysia crispata TaxID=231223 RepID=A0AAE0Y4X8_9GAST|nr:hypothetical protein RRG08_026511 [Elysia crispata]
MEVKAAEVLWSRSVQRHKMRYTTMVSDGDSKAHTKVLEIQPYGPNEFIDKEDCISHVRKKLGAALCNLVSDCSKRGVTLGGGGEIVAVWLQNPFGSEAADTPQKSHQTSQDCSGDEAEHSGECLSWILDR